MAIFKGAGVAIVTPMNEDGSVNYEKFGELIEFQIANGTDAIIVCGTTGESSTLTHEEHLDTIKYCVDKVAKRIPVVAGTGSNCTDTAVYLSQKAEKYGVDGILLDLGVSSPQLDDGSRGFSYMADAPLDMRMDVSQPLTAERILATYDAAELVRIFKEYGEERFSRQIARAIVARRDKEPFTTTAQLNRLVDEVVPQAHRPAGNPAKRVFQALRIEVNGELDKLASTLPQAANRLHVGGRLVVESYHSLEDKTVKSFMAQGLRVDVPAGLPVIPPDAQPFFTDLTRGAIKADEHEIAANPRSASVRLRAVEVSREIPSRWRKRFTQTAQGLNDVKIQGSASPGRAKNTARIRTRRG